MTTTPTTLYTALLAFQRTVGPVKKDASNPAFRTKYATLQSVLETVDEPLSANGLVLLQRFGHDERGPVLITEIVHAATGDKVASELPVVSKDPTDPQKLGGAITYARRYSLLALLGLAPEDDDGNAASKPAPPRAPYRTEAPPRPAPQPEGQPARSAHPAVVAAGILTDNGKPVAPDSWTLVWTEAKARGIHDKAALAAFLGVANTATLSPTDILATLRNVPPTPPSFAG